MSEAVLISVVTVTYNCRLTICETLDSVKNQTYQNYEHVILDGDSSDGTSQILSQYACGNQNVILRIGKDHGLYDALNKAIALCSGKYIVILHGDDTFISTDCLEYLAKEVLVDSKDIYYGPVAFTAKNSSNLARYWRPSQFNKLSLFLGWMPPHTGIIWSTQFVKSVSPYKLDVGPCADYHYCIAAFKKTTSHKLYDRCLIIMKMGGLSTNGSYAKLRNIYYDYMILNDHKFRLPLLTVCLKRFRKVFQFRFRG